jgi:hypothetical protein
MAVNNNMSAMDRLLSEVRSGQAKPASQSSARTQIEAPSRSSSQSASDSTISSLQRRLAEADKRIADDNRSRKKSGVYNAVSAVGDYLPILESRREQLKADRDSIAADIEDIKRSRQEINKSGGYGKGGIGAAFQRGIGQAQSTQNALEALIGDVEQEDLEGIVAGRARVQNNARNKSEQEAYERFQAADGFFASAREIFTNGLLLANVAIESIPSSMYSMVGGAVGGVGGAFAGTAVGGPAGTVIGGRVGGGVGSGVGSFATEYGSAMLETFERNGIDLDDPEALKAAIDDPKIMEEAKERGLRRGIAVAAFDALSVGLAGKLGGSQIARRVGGDIAEASAGRRAGAVLAGGAAETVSQGALGAGGEASAQLLSEGRITSPQDIVAEFAGELPTGAIEATVGTGAEYIRKDTASQPNAMEDEELATALAARGEANPVREGGGLLEDQNAVALRGMGNISAGGMNYTPAQILDIARNNESNPRIADIMSQPVSDVAKVQQVARILNQEEVARVEPEAVRRISGMFGGTNSVSNSKQMIADELSKISPEIIAESPTLSAIAQSLESTGKQFVSGLRNAVSNYQPTAQTGTLFARPERGGEGSVIMSQEDVTNEAQREREAQQAFRLADVRQRRFDTATGELTQREDLRAGAPEPEAQFFLNPAVYGEDLGGIAATIVGAEGGKVRIQYESPTELDGNGAPVIISEDVDPTAMFDRVVRGTARMTQELAGDVRKPRKGTGTDLNPRQSVDRTSTRALVPTESGLPATISPTRMTGFEDNTDQMPVTQNAQANPQQEPAPNVEGNVEAPNEISGAPAQIQAPAQNALPAPAKEEAPAPEAKEEAPAPAQEEAEAESPTQDAGRKVEKHVENIEDKILNDDRNGVVRYANKVHKEGLIDDADLAEIKRMSKDKDMGAEDIGPELISQLNTKRGDGGTQYSGRRDVVRPKAKKASDVVRDTPLTKDAKAAPETEAKPEIDYEAVIQDRLDKIAARGGQGRIVANRLRSLLKKNDYNPTQLYYAFQMGEVVSRVLPSNSKVDVLFVPSITATDAGAAAASGIDLGAEASGAYRAYSLSQNGFRGLITLSLSDKLTEVARENAAHEAFHVIQDFLRVDAPDLYKTINSSFYDGMRIKDLDPSIIRKLKTLDTDGEGSVYDSLINSFGDTPLSGFEAQAVAFGALVDAKDRGVDMKGMKASFIRFVDFVSDMLRGFRNIFRANRVDSVADIFEGFRTGETSKGFTEPAPLAEQDSGVQYSGRKKDSATGEFKKNIKASKLSADELFAQPDVKQGTMGVTEAAMEIQKRTLSILGRPITAAGQKDDLLAQTVAHEVKSELARSGKRNASGWYTEEMRKATAVASMIHPEIATDVGAQLHFTAALAITSQNQSVDANAVFAERWYEHYKKNGKFPENEGWGKAASSIISNAKLFNSIVEKYGAEAVSKFFATKFTVRELRAAGFRNVSGASEEMVYGSAVLGPKIGFGFYSNLNGRYDPVTIDMWFMRTWGRMTGDLIGADPELIQQQEERLTKALADDGRPTNAYGAELLEVAQAESKAFEKDFKVNRAAYDSGEKVKPETALAAQRLLASFEDTKDAPKADWQRTWIRDIVAKSQQILQGDGINITNADLQAILWYPEKRLWSKKFGVREKGKGADDAGSAGETSYYDEFVRIAKKRGFTDEQISTAVQPKGGRGQGSGSVLGGKAVNQNANRQSGAANEFAPRDARRFIQDSVITRLNKEFPILDGAGSATSGRPSEHVSRKAGGNLARSLEGRTPVVATYSHSVKVKNALAVAGVDAPKFLELTTGPASAKLYHRLISEAQKANKAGAAVYVYDKKDYADMRLFLTEDGLTGFALKGDDLVSVFKHPSSETRGVAIPLARMAVWLGARRLDAYDTVLPYLYSTAGFKVAARMKWDNEQAPKIWDKTEFSAFNNGEPDVVFMYHDPARSDFYTKGEGEYFDQYNDAVAAQSGKAGNVQYSGRTGRAVYTPERTDLLLQDLSYPDDDNKTKAWITFMSPDQFLGLTLSNKGRDLLATMDPEKTRARPLNVDELRRVDQPLFLEIADPYMASGKEQPRRVMGHEGRHRMAAFKAAGIEQVPVILRRQDGRGGQLEDLNNFTLAPQRGGRSDQYNSGDTNAVLSEAIPFNYANAGRIREMMDDGDVRFSGRRGRTVDSPSFKKWFGNSKVVDAKGRPLVVFHGTEMVDEETDGPFEVFDTAPWGTQDGFSFSDSEQIARAFTGYARDGTLYKVFLKIENPMSVDAKRVMVKDGYGGWEHDNAAKDKLIAEAKKKGHDGVIIRNLPEQVGIGTEYVAFKSTQIKSAESNNGNFDPEDPRISYSGRRGRGGRQTGPQALRPNAPKFKTGPSVLGVDPMAAKYPRLVNWYERLVNRTRSLKQLTKNIDDFYNDKTNIDRAEQLMGSRAAYTTQEFHLNELKPVLKEIGKQALSINEVETYMHNRHAVERNAIIRERNDAFPDGGSGINDAAAKAYLSALSPAKRNRLEAVAKKLDVITNGTLQVLQDSGIESAETIRNLRNAYKFYVPLFREGVDGGHALGTRGASVEGSALKAAVGSSKPVSSIIANIVTQREAAINRAEANRLGNTVFQAALENGDQAFWMVIDPSTATPDQVRKQLAAMGMDPDLADDIFKSPTKRAYNKRTGNVDTIADTNFKRQPNVFATRVDGTDKFIVFNPDEKMAVDIATVLKNDDLPTLEGASAAFIDNVGRITRLWSQLRTQYMPEFGPVNFARDIWGAMVNLTSTPLDGEQFKVMTKAPLYAKKLVRVIRATDSGEPVPAGSQEVADLFDRFEKAGGRTAIRESFFKNFDRDPEKLEAELQKAVKQLSAGKTSAPKVVVDYVTAWNDALENATRLATFKIAVDKGMTDAQAAEIAKNITVNFNQKGQWTREINSLYGFSNASIASTDRNIKTMLGKAGKKILIGGVGLGVIQGLVLAAAGYDEDDVPEWVKDHAFIIPLGLFADTNKYVPIPMPYFYNMFPAIGRRMVEAARGQLTAGQFIGGTAEVMINSVNPIAYGAGFIEFVSPSVFDMFVQYTQNEDGLGRRIYNKDFNDLNPTTGMSRARGDTTVMYAMYSKAAEVINAVTGGDEYEVGGFSPTPEEVKFFVEQTLPPMQFLYRSTATLEKGVRGEQIEPNDIAFVRRFYGEVGGKTAEGGKFYDNVKAVNELKNTVKLREENGQDTTEVFDENPKAELIDYVGSYYRDVSDLRRERRKMILEGAKPSETQKLDDEITALMTEFNNLAEEAEKK